MKTFCVYIMASDRNGTLYVGVTSNVLGRVWQHKNKVVPGFTSEHNVNRLVYCETHDNFQSAVRREKQVKKWNRKWKLELIESTNPEWADLSDGLTA